MTFSEVALRSRPATLPSTPGSADEPARYSSTATVRRGSGPSSACPGVPVASTASAARVAAARRIMIAPASGAWPLGAAPSWPDALRRSPGSVQRRQHARLELLVGGRVLAVLLGALPVLQHRVGRAEDLARALRLDP